VHRIHVGDDLRVHDLVVEEERAEEELPALHHVLYGSGKGRVPYNDGFYKAVEKGGATWGEQVFVDRSRGGTDS